MPQCENRYIYVALEYFYIILSLFIQYIFFYKSV